MINAVSIAAIMAAVFLLLALMILLFKNKSNYTKRVEGIRNILSQSKQLKEKREKFFTENDNLASIDDEKLKSLWLNEIIFYQNVCDVICTINPEKISKLPSHVSLFLDPYLDLISHFSENQAVEISEESTNDMEVTPENFAKLEQRYQQKIDENTKLQKQIDILKKSPHSANNTDDSHELLIQVLTDFSQLCGLPDNDLSKHNHSDLAITYGNIKNDINKKLSNSNNQSAKLLDQIRSEKMVNLKKYKRAMLLLFNTYKEYASAFGLEAPQDPNIEIDEFETFIEEN